jgi:hypothetical protein
MAAIVGDFGSSSSFLEGSSSQWVDQLLPSAIEDGVGTFLLATDDRPTLERFAAEVIPGLRLAVARTSPDRLEITSRSYPTPALDAPVAVDADRTRRKSQRKEQHTS